jgi:hypothetical protein
MANADRNATHSKEWRELATTITVNAADLPQAAVPLAALEVLLSDLPGLIVEQNLHRANKQQVSQRLDALHREGAKLATLLRNIAKQHYGSRNEKLVEFGIPPFRGRARKAAPPVETPTPTVPTPTSSTAK